MHRLLDMNSFLPNEACGVNILISREAHSRLLSGPISHSNRWILLPSELCPHQLSQRTQNLLIWVSASLPAVTVSSDNKHSASSPRQSGHNGTNNEWHPQKILHLYNIWGVRYEKCWVWVVDVIFIMSISHYLHFLPTARNVLIPLLPLLPWYWHLPECVKHGVSDVWCRGVIFLI